MLKRVKSKRFDPRRFIEYKFMKVEIILSLFVRIPLLVEYLCEVIQIKCVTDL
jgi:hypothetical protein